MSRSLTVITILVVAFSIIVTVFIFWHRASASRAGEEQFRDKVLCLMMAVFPTKTFEIVPADPHVILVDGYQLGLDNLRREFDLSDKSEETLKELVRKNP